MSNEFKFVKVEDFFKNSKDWIKLNKAQFSNYDENEKVLSLICENNSHESCAMIIQFPRKDTFRMRFNPSKVTSEEYSHQNTRSIIGNSFDELIHTFPNFTTKYDYDTENNIVQITTFEEEDKPYMKMIITLTDFNLKVYKCNQNNEEILVLSTDDYGIRYDKFCSYNGIHEYSIVLPFVKPFTAKYIGFGETGGKKLYKNAKQLTYMNYDNMMYKQVYGRGALDDREPLYHNNPFFMEFYGTPTEDIVCGLFMDNASESFVDVGYSNSQRYMLGTLLGDLDCYFFLGQNAQEVMTAYLSFVGTARLKPRYVLGYHQGCYGYEKRDHLEKVVEDYRRYQIPIDGLHVDVDLQRNYETFTIDEERFPNPKEMFSKLKEKGIKCCTNITPIISNQNSNYETYKSGLEKGYFVTDERVLPCAPNEENYQDFDFGKESIRTIDDIVNQPNKNPIQKKAFNNIVNNYNSGKPYEGAVYYGGDRGVLGHYPDFARSEVRKWWGEQYNYLFEQGLEFVWQDMTSPAIMPYLGDMRSFPFKLLITDDFLKKYNYTEGNDPQDQQRTKSPAIKVWSLYPYNLHKATFMGLNDLPSRANKRNFIIGRGGFTGMHRYAGLWTGDNASTWDFLKINVAQVLALGISGEPITGEDTGGFMASRDGEQWVDPELFIRWMIVGSFLPWFRNHYIKKSSKLFQEPYKFQTVIDEVPPSERPMYNYVLKVTKYYIEQRYRLMQLFYDAMFENTFTGMPIVRPLFLNDWTDKAIFNDKIAFLNNEFFVGKDLLVAPILDKQCDENMQGRRDVYLPAGSNWYCFMGNKRPLLYPVEGGTTIFDYDAHISDDKNHIGFVCPVFVRAGAVIPTIELEQYVGEKNAKGEANPITINIYPGAHGQYTMYLDDGVSRSSAPTSNENYGVSHSSAPIYNKSQDIDPMAKGEYREVLIKHNYIDVKHREININRTYDNYTPKYEDFFFVAILHDEGELNEHYTQPLKRVTIGDKEISIITEGNIDQRSASLWNSDENKWYFNENINISFIKVFDNNKNFKINIEYM
ncbi:TIM-barrel domain-containing protein [Clostridium sp. DJ247]|uniref:TIM-barrel domain-containing protein n=1 Tax=Clostridium sp. DJ247 TaxID=2726188 RepID=UPI0016296377|nr:TIM-barrel domain-containing protein [Clostridium sp. DJ247]MBC2582102.1 hypothetical protein [Clostridium sp. DJ247]